MAMKKFTNEEIKKAAEDVFDRDWDGEDPEYTPNKDNRVSRMLEGRCPVGTMTAIMIQAELNEANRMLSIYESKEREPDVEALS